MGKLILTSAGFKNKNIESKFIEFLNKDVKSAKVLFIPTAAITEGQKLFIPLCKNDLLDAGIIDSNIISYDLDRKLTEEKICSYNAIYVCGGTPEYLLDKMIQCEFKESLKIFLNSGGIYVGVSAGSIVLAQNLKNNLGYIHSTLHVHEEKGTASGSLNYDKTPIIKLADNQAIIINNTEIYIYE